MNHLVVTKMIGEHGYAARLTLAVFPDSESGYNLAKEYITRTIDEGTKCDTQEFDQADQLLFSIYFFDKDGVKIYYFIEKTSYYQNLKDLPLGTKASLKQETLDELKKEIVNARHKFPENKYLYEALLEEVGEAFRSETSYNPKDKEWLQVACVALRLYEEGCETYFSHNIREAVAKLELNARNILNNSGIPQ